MLPFIVIVVESIMFATVSRPEAKDRSVQFKPQARSAVSVVMVMLVVHAVGVGLAANVVTGVVHASVGVYVSAGVKDLVMLGVVVLF